MRMTLQFGVQMTSPAEAWLHLGNQCHGQMRSWKTAIQLEWEFL